MGVVNMSYPQFLCHLAWQLTNFFNNIQWKGEYITIPLNILNIWPLITLLLNSMRPLKQS